MLDKSDRNVGTESYARLARDFLLGLAATARGDVGAFHEFVMRDERSQRRIRTLPFQRLALAFMEAFHYCVWMMPPGHSKTSILTTRTLHRIGQNPTRRCMFVSKDGEKSTKSVTMIKTYIEESSELRLVFPKLRPNQRKGEPWTQAAITVDRPLGIKDPTVSAASIAKGIAGYRLSDIVVDDVLDEKNTRTKDARDKMWELHETVLLHRLDQSDEDDVRFVVINTAWDSDDYLHRLMDSEKYGEGWPALLMDAFGNVYVRNVPTDKWDPPELRPAKCNQDERGLARNPEGPFRITESDEAYSAATGDAPDNATLWWQRFTREKIESERDKMQQITFNQTYLLICRTEETARCKQSWIDGCLKAGRDEGHHSMCACSPEHPYPDTGNLIVMGVDLAFGVGQEHDDNAICVLEFLDDGRAKLLELLTVQTNSVAMRKLIVSKALAYGNCHVMVESVGAQKMMVEHAREANAAIKVQPFSTSGAGEANKWDRVTGVESVFLAIEKSALILPCDPAGRYHKEVQKFIDACIYYLPTKHTPDNIMAAWFALHRGHKLWGYAKMEKDAKASTLASATTR